MTDFQTFVFELQSPSVFGPKHLIGSAAMILMIAILLVLFFVILKKPNHGKILKIMTLSLLTLELMKYSHALITDGSFPTIYIPMQLCSFSLYLMPLVSFGKGRIRDFFLPTAFAVGLLAGSIVLLYPATVLGGTYGWTPFVDNIIPIISFLYHALMILFSLYLLISKVYRPNIKDFFKVYLSLMGFAALAMITNAIFGTDMMFLNTGAGNPFQFILLQSGRTAYYGVMMLLAAVLLFIPFLPSFFHQMLHNASQPRIQKQEN